MSHSAIELLQPSHKLEQFDCGKEALNTWLRQRALTNQATGTSRTWVVLDNSNEVVAFYTSSTASVTRKIAGSRFSRNQPEPIPAILLGRMGVDLGHMKQGLGAALLKHFMLKVFEVNEIIGVRLVLVHAKDEDAKGFYQKYGFTVSLVDPLTLMMVIPPS